MPRSCVLPSTRTRTSRPPGRLAEDGMGTGTTYCPKPPLFLKTPSCRAKWKQRKQLGRIREVPPEFGRFYGVWMPVQSNFEFGPHWHEANGVCSISLLASQPVFLTTEASSVGSWSLPAWSECSTKSRQTEFTQFGDLSNAPSGFGYTQCADKYSAVGGSEATATGKITLRPCLRIPAASIPWAGGLVVAPHRHRWGSNGPLL